jgi:hypothetical protein
VKLATDQIRNPPEFHGHLALAASLRCVLRVLGYPCGFNRVPWRFVKVPKSAMEHRSVFV